MTRSFVSWDAYDALQQRLITAETNLGHIRHAASAVIDTWIDVEEPTPLDVGLAALATAVGDSLQGRGGTRRLVDAIIRDTGQVVQIEEPDEEPPTDQLRAVRLARLGRLGAPESRPDDGIDRHDVHKRLRAQKDEKQ